MQVFHSLYDESTPHSKLLSRLELHPILRMSGFKGIALVGNKRYDASLFITHTPMSEETTTPVTPVVPVEETAAPVVPTEVTTPMPEEVTPEAPATPVVEAPVATPTA